ncbi:MAG: hypothetical protein Q9222_007599, partial [Ikaeria aurantiellina]
MVHPVLLTVLLLTITTLPLASAVTVTIFNTDGYEVPQICRNLPPGICCRAFPVTPAFYNNPFSPGSVIFASLLPTDIAAVWVRRDTIDACSGIPIRTHVGPGNWIYQGTGDTGARGASY